MLLANRRIFGHLLGIRTFLPVVFVAENYEAIGSCVLTIDPVKPEDAEVSAITVLIWDRVLQLAIVGLLIGYARDFAAGMGFHHLLVRKAEGVVEGILRIIGWEDCECMDLGAGAGAGSLCAGSWAAGVFSGEEESQVPDHGQPEGHDQTEEEMDGMVEESGSSSDEIVDLEEDLETSDQRCRKITLDELIGAAARKNWDLVTSARTKRSFDGLESATAEETSTSKRTKVDVNSCRDDMSGCVPRQQEQAKLNAVTKAGVSPSTSSVVPLVSEKPTSQAHKVPPPPIIGAPSPTINVDPSLVKNEIKYHRAGRGTRGRGDKRNAGMKLAELQRAARATSRYSLSAASEKLSLLPKPAVSGKTPEERTIKEVSSRSQPDATNSSIPEAGPHPSSVPTVSQSSAFLPTALTSIEPAGFALDSTGHGGIIDVSGSARQRPGAQKAMVVQDLIDKIIRRNNKGIDPTNPAQRPESKINPKGQALVDKGQALLDKVQRDKKYLTDPATLAKRDLTVQTPTNAIRVPDNADGSARGDGNPSRASSTTLNTSGKENVRSVLRTRIPKNAQINGELNRPAKLKASDNVNNDSPPSSAFIPFPKDGEQQPRPSGQQQQLPSQSHSPPLMIPDIINPPPLKPAAAASASETLWMGNPVAVSKRGAGEGGGTTTTPLGRYGPGDHWRPNRY